MRWADVYVPHVSPASMSPASMRRCPRALSPGARCDGPTSTSACWPTVLPSGIVALRGRDRSRVKRERSDHLSTTGSRVPTGNRVPKPGLDGRTLRPVFVAFDCLWRRGRDLRELPLSDRRLSLEHEVGDGALILPARRLDADGLKAWHQALERGYEGVVAKDERACYVGGSSTSWMKA